MIYPKFSVTVACIYRSPDGCMETFLEKFEILINSLKNKGKPVILCGDFNLNFLTTDSQLSEFRSLIHSYNLVETIDTPTRITSHSQTCLDQIIIDRDFYPFTVENINLGISDHNAIFIHTQVETDIDTKGNKFIIYNRSFNDENI